MLVDSNILIYATKPEHAKLRQQRKLTLGDALIAATCLERGYTLATCNIGDFAWIEELKVFNPLVEG
jgi:hypothetical protein